MISLELWVLVAGLFKTDKSWITVNFDFSFIAFQCRYLFILCISVLQMAYVNPKKLLIKNFNINFLQQLLVCLFMLDKCVFT